MVQQWQGVELWTNHHNAGPHIDASGRGCADVHEAATEAGTWRGWPEHLGWLIDRGAKFSRLDVAVDVLGGALDVQTLADAVTDGRVVSRWKDASWQLMKSIGSKQEGGCTLYAGSPKSSTRLCVYDKAAEQGLTETGAKWTRIEFRARHEAAISLAAAIADRGMMAAMSVIQGYADFRAPTGGTLAVWREALYEAGKTPLAVKKRGGTYESMARWLEEDVAASLAALLEANGGDWDRLVALVEEGRKRYSPKHRTMIQRRREQLASDRRDAEAL